MKILKVIHGYPNRYSAGSEVYSQILCRELVNQGHEVLVFSRYEHAYEQEYSIKWEEDALYPQIKICLINMAQARDGYRHSAVDKAFTKLLEQYLPDVVHIGHLNHLSSQIVSEIHEKNIPIIFTLHDFWLMCPRGQFLQGTNTKVLDLYPTCESQENAKCAKLCYSRYFSSQEDLEDLQYWTNWVEKRMDHIRKMTSYVDLFLAPSQYLKGKFIHQFDIEPCNITYLDYGFHRDRLRGRKRQKEKEFVFGYIGTHKQAKGIHLLLDAFSRVHQRARLKIYGSPISVFTQSLKAYLRTQGSHVEDRVEWMGEYENDQIVNEVFNHVDAIVVPSIWGENSPLVIHEALEAKVPVITADYGGMKEYIHHEVNGLLFKHRDSLSLAKQMEKMIDDPAFVSKITSRGYLQSESGHIPDIQEHTVEMIELYWLAIYRRKETYEKKNRSLAYHF